MEHERKVAVAEAMSPVKRFDVSVPPFHVSGGFDASHPVCDCARGVGRLR